MTGIKVDAVHFAKQGLRGLGWLLSCRRPWPSFLECGPKEKPLAVWELCETLGCGTEFPTLTPNVRPHIARAAPVPWLGPAQVRVRHRWRRSTDICNINPHLLCAFTYVN